MEWSVRPLPTASCIVSVADVCCAVLDIPYRSRDADDDDDAEVESVQYVDAAAGTVNVVASTPRTARYWETHQMATHVNAAPRTTATTMLFSCVLLMPPAVTALLLV